TKKDGNVSPSSSGGSKSNKANESEKKPDKKETSNNCIDINSAEESEVQGIIHIGPERATELINERPYEKVEDLGKIDVIGESRIKDIMEEVKACVGGYCMKTQGVLDQITDNQCGTILVEDLNKEFILNKSELPADAKEGTWFDLVIENEEIKSLIINQELTELRKQTIEEKLAKLKNRSRSNYKK